MAYTPIAPTLTLCDNLVSALSAAWKPVAPSKVARGYLERIDLSEVKGRLVLFFPEGYDNRPAARGLDWFTHRVMVLVFERYADAADSSVTVPQEWIDERVDFVYSRIVQGFDFSRGAPTWNANLTTLSADVTEIYDAEKLEQNKEFWCAVEIVFQEQRDA